MAYQKLDPEFKARWIAALRSGEYKQGVEQLAKPNGDEGYLFCCLGVACAVEGVPADILDDTYIQHISFCELEVMGKHSAIIGNDSNPVVDRLTQMNDNDRKSFAEIADWIEKHL